MGGAAEPVCGGGGAEGEITLSKVQGGLPGDLSITASTCYMVDSMPLAFTQEDFLVF